MSVPERARAPVGPDPAPPPAIGPGGDRPAQPISRSVRALAFRFALSLTVLVTLAVAGAAVIDHRLSAQQQYASGINLSGRQRMLTLLAVAQVNDLSAQSDPVERNGIRDAIRRTILDLDNARRAVAAVVPEDSASTRGLPAFVAALGRIVAGPEQDVADHGADIARIRALAPALVAAFDSETAALQAASERDQTRLRLFQLAGLGAFLALLLALALGVFRPILKHLRIQAAALERLTVTLEDKVTERTREAETRAAALAAQEARLRGILDNVADVVITATEDGRIESFNRAAEQVFGYAAAEIVGDSVHRLLPVELRARHESQIQRYRSTGQPAAIGKGLREEMALHKSGRRFPVELALGEMHVGDRRLFIAAIRDISERRQAEAELKVRDAAIASSLNAIALTDLDGLLTYVNAAFLQLWGHADTAAVLARPIADFWADETAQQEAAKALQRTGRWTGELTARRADGALFIAEVAANRVLDSWGKPLCYMVSCIDVTQRRQAEEALRSAKKEAELANRSKSEFLANMSHELRTPLNAIIGFSEIMEQEMIGPIGSARYRGYSRDIHESGIHLLEIINDILDLSRVEAGRLTLRETLVTPAEIVDSCRRMIHDRAEAAKVAVVARVAVDLPRLWVDARLLKQVILNLLSNAVKFTPAGGRITISAELGAAALAITVRDTGIGIPADQIAQVLKPFVQVDNVLTRRHQGTGLGLPLARSLIELHGGELVMDSAIGEGTTVTVRLPADRLRPGPGGPRSEADESRDAAPGWTRPDAAA